MAGEEHLARPSSEWELASYGLTSSCRTCTYKLAVHDSGLTQTTVIPACGVSFYSASPGLLLLIE
jgi:hypothetical protein